MYLELLFFLNMFVFCFPLAGDLPAVCLLRHIWTHYALFEDQPGLPVLPSTARTFHPAW